MEVNSTERVFYATSKILQNIEYTLLKETQKLKFQM